MKRLSILLIVLMAAVLAPMTVFAWHGPTAVEGAHGGVGNDTTAWLLTDAAVCDTSIVFTWPGAGKDDLFVGYTVTNADSTADVDIVLEQRICSVDSTAAWARADSVVVTGLVEAGSAGGVWDPTLLSPPVEFRFIVQGNTANDWFTYVQLWVFRSEKGVN